jgi:hypothetical protein
VEQTDEVILEHVNNSNRLWSSTDLQDVQKLADRVNEAKLIMESNCQVMGSIRDYYRHLVDVDEFPLRITCRGDVNAFITKLNYLTADIKMHIARADLLLRMTDDRKNLVSCSISFSPTKLIQADFTAYAKSGGENDGVFCFRVAKRSPSNAHHSGCYHGVSSSYICFSMSKLFQLID